MNKIDQEIYGYGVVSTEIEKYLQAQSNVILLATLVKQAVEKIQKWEYPYRRDVYEHILNFHQKLLKYADTLDQ